MQINNKKNSGIRVEHLSFIEWVQQNEHSIASHLQREGIAFLNEQAENLKHPVLELNLNDRWNYLDKPAKKQSYRGKLSLDSHGVPYLNLTFYSFRHGGYSARFDSKAALKLLWQQGKAGRSPASTFPAIKLNANPLTRFLPPEPNWLAQDKALWERLALEGSSHYLTRKKLSTFPIPGIRYDKQCIAVQLVDTNNQFYGLQKIYNSGDKRFTKGLAKKGHFAVIGEERVPLKVNTIHVCEGVATAASLHLALGEPVFAGLDAFNLLPVCRALKRQYPKTPLIIWADNDWQKEEKRLPNGKLLGNTGLIQAHRAALKCRNAQVAIPDFSPFPKEAITHATDFNDLHQLGGFKAITETEVVMPDLSEGLRQELHLSTRRIHGILSPQRFKHAKKLTYHCQYLPKDLCGEEGVHLIRSPIGTGKTAIVEALVKTNPQKSVLFTTHLISLVENAAARLGITSYSECDNFDLQMEHRLAVCLNSLGKLTAEGPLRRYDIVIIDEIEQVLARLTTRIEQKPLVFAVFQQLMREAKTLICLDAHLSKATLEMIASLCPNHPISIHLNEYQVGSERQIVLHEQGESVQLCAMKALTENKNVYLAFNSKKEAFKTFSAFKAAFPEKKGLYISSDNTGDAENQAFFNAVNQVTQRYDYLICTPSVSTGVSIDNGHFDFVGGVFNAQINTANDCMQALGRVRNHPLLHVYCEKRQGNKSLKSEVIAAKWATTQPYDFELMNLTSDGQRILMNESYERLSVTVTQMRHLSANDFYLQLALLALQDGIQLTYWSEPFSKETAKNLKQLKKSCSAEALLALINAELPLSVNEAQNLANKPRKTFSETRSYKKQQLLDFYKLAESDEEGVQLIAKLDDEGQLKKQILQLELALGNQETAKKRFLAQFEEGAQFAPDITHFATLQEFYQQLFKTLHLTFADNAFRPNHFTYDKEKIKKSELIDWIEAHRQTLQGIITLPNKEQLQAEPLRFLSGILTKLGLKQKRVGRTQKNVYQLDSERLTFLNAILKRRQEDLNVREPLCLKMSNYIKISTGDFFAACLSMVKSFLIPDTALVSSST